jgi:hypothetical protein
MTLEITFVNEVLEKVSDEFYQLYLISLQYPLPLERGFNCHK